MSTVVKDLGAVSAYAYAVEKGYTGTEEEFAELMASYATVGQTAVNAAQTATTKASEAATSATTATTKASEATTAATTATTKAGEASTSASTATSAKDTAVSAASTATTKATEATTAAATATSAKTDAVAANTAAQSAKTAAQTAQTGAETAAASVQSSAAQIQTNADDISELKEDLTLLSAFSADTVTDGNMVRASDGKLIPSSAYKTHEYIVYGLSKLYLTPNFTNATYGYALYDASKTYISGDVYTVSTITEITVPDGAYYIRYTENKSVSAPVISADWGLLLETKANNATTQAHTAEMYEDVYSVTNYVPSDRLAVQEKYYDTNGALQSASNMDTTGIIPVPYGIKDIYYNAYRNTTIPTILFFNASMEIVGTVIATVAPVYGDTNYKGYATIPDTAVFMEFSMSNTKAGQIVTVRYSKVNNNVARITALETDPLYGKKITCTGDSITSAIHSVPYNGYVAQIANAHGMTIDNQAIWGAVFPQNKLNADTTARGCIYDTIALMDANADIVIISGGINDAEYHADATYWGSVTGDYDDTLDTETFCGALEGICKTALQKWSGKPIIFVFEHRMTLDNTTYGAHFNDVQYPLMVEILKKWGIPFVDLYHEMPSLAYNEGYKEAYTTGDGTHPNIAGYAKFYVPRVYAKIKEVMGL